MINAFRRVFLAVPIGDRFSERSTLKIVAVNVVGTKTTQNYYFGAPSGVPQVTNFGARYRKSGSSSAIRRGNHTDPQAWSFSVQESGDLTGSSSMYSGPSYSISNGMLSDVDAMYSLLSKVNASDPYNKALAKLYEKIRSDTDLSIDLYQGGQTVQMLKSLAASLGNPTRTLANALGGLVKSGRIRRGSDLISNKWLEWQYGIKPTMATIHDLTSDMIELTSDASGFYVVKSRASSVEPFPGVIKRGTWSSVYNVKCSGEDSKRVEICVHYGIGNADVNALSQFTSLNPVSFIYENVPFSFVLDWIVDVGGYLRMMETATMSGLSFRTGYVSRSRRTIVSATVDDAFTDQYGRTKIAKANGWAVEKSLNRTVLGTMPTPSLPSLNISLGSQRLFSAASLLRGFLK